MTGIMTGIRVLEVAEHTFVPACTGLLSDWGAEVIKVEQVERGDAVRGLASGTQAVHALHEHSNRGKRSIGLNLSDPDGLEVLYKLAASSDVFISNKVKRIRQKLKIEAEDLRAQNPSIIYVRGTGQGERGPDADKGSYDLLNFWHRSGASMGTARPDGSVPFLPGPGFGDSIGAMTVAGGIMGALFHRERTGDAPIVDVSLLSTGMWAMGAGIASAAVVDNWPWPPAIPNPLSRTYVTKDRRWIALCCLQSAHYWGPLCEIVGRPQLAKDPRFATQQLIMANSADAIEILAEVFAERTVDEWRDCLESFVGQWTVVQSAGEAAVDPQAVANGYLQDCETAAGVPFQLVSAPVQFDEQPGVTSRAPTFNEHGDEILSELGYDWDTVVDLKVRGVVA